MNDGIVIKVEGVYKNFQLPHEKKDSIKSLVTSLGSKHSRTIETQHALKNISFEVKKGEFFGIVGRNGSGKSTLLKIIAEIYQPTKGSMHKEGKLVPFIELGVGFNPELTGRENVYLNGALLGFSRKEIEAQYNDIVEFAELEPFMDQKLKNYSSGMQVRLAFSVATRANADILLIDEVLAVGDADFQKKCFNFFRQLKGLKKTIIFVSHDMSAVTEYCDRAILIDKSEIIESGSADKVALGYGKLFAASDDGRSVSVGQKRWGDQMAVAQKVTLNSQYTKSDAVIKLNIDVRAIKDVENVSIGFTVKNKAGQSLLGTNTKIVNGEYFSIHKGELKTIEWEFPNIFNDGNYYIEPAVVYNYDTIADWWEEAAQFTVIDTKKTPHLVNPEFKCRIQVKKD